MQSLTYPLVRGFASHVCRMSVTVYEKVDGDSGMVA
jgi:hypothetical protein